MIPSRVVAIHACIASSILSLVGPGVASSGPARSPAPAAAAVVVGPESGAVVYLGGVRVLPPYRLELDGERVLLNGFDVDPTGGPDASEGAALAPEVEGALRTIRETTARADALIDSLLAADEPDASVEERTAAVFRAEPLALDVSIGPVGRIEVTWRGVPGRQVVAIAGRRPRVAEAAEEPDALARSWRDWIAASLSRGEFYAAGVGYRISLAGALVDSMQSAIGAFRPAPAETLRVGRRTYAAFGHDLRTAWARESGR